MSSLRSTSLPDTASAHVLFAAILSLVSIAGSCQTAPHSTSTSTHPPSPELYEEPAWQQICSRAEASALPPAAAALAAAASAAPALAAGQCDEQTLYYGFGYDPDYSRALDCAYRHRAHPNGPSNSILEGPGTLAMLYGNGYGAARDYGMAVRFACETAHVGGQNVAERIGRLEALRDGKLAPSAIFDLCDEQMSGVMGAYCSDLSERQADVGRTRRVAGIIASLPKHAQDLFKQLQASEDAFEQARFKGEYPGGGGSGSVGFALEDQNRLREQFVVNLERFRIGSLPKTTPSGLRSAHRELDAAFHAALDVPRTVDAPFGEPTAAGIKATQTAWKQLVQRWMLFSPVAFPRLPPDAAANELLRLRIHQLKKAAY